MSSPSRSASSCSKALSTSCHPRQYGSAIPICSLISAQSVAPSAACWSAFGKLHRYRSSHAPILIDIADNPFDLGLFDGQIADAIARGHVGDQRGGGGGLAVEAQPDARPLAAGDLGVRDMDAVQFLIEVHDQGALAAEACAQRL